jgi:hypothetical protein
VEGFFGPYSVLEEDDRGLFVVHHRADRLGERRAGVEQGFVTA